MCEPGPASPAIKGHSPEVRCRLAASRRRAASVVGSLFGVAALTAAEGDPVEIATTGVYELPKDPTAVIAVGDRVAWDDAAKQIKLPAVGLYPVGVATEAAGSGMATVKVRLDGIATQAA